MALAVAAAALGTVPDSADAQSAGAGYFSDDDSSVHEPGLDALAAWGVLAGMECGEGLICPGEPLKRWEMAVWLVRVLDGADPGPVDASRFADVDAGLWWAPFVDRLFALGVTVGCRTEPARFCPERSVTRAQMATFLKRAFDLEPAASAGFIDVDADGTHSANIDALAVAGITVGCRRDPLRYCPGRDVNRAQMATFLARALGLVELPASVRFVAVDAGGGHTCALRADSTVVCWGSNSEGQAAAPDGSFTEVAAGGRHSCGLRTDSTIACWGGSVFGQTRAPEGEFSAVTAGNWHSCGLRIDGQVECWGNGWERIDTPGDELRAISAGGFRTCGLRTDGTVVCWGGSVFGQTRAPEGEFSAVTAGNWHSCGLRIDGTVACWGDNYTGEAAAPGGEFRAVAASVQYSCGVRADGTVVCWGYSDDGATLAPDGQFSAVSAGYQQSCGVRTDGTVACWGYSLNERTDYPGGELTAVSGGREHFCGLRADSTAVCWGRQDGGRAFAPSGRFSAVSAGELHTCGVRTDGTVACWGDNLGGQAAAPGGEFRAVAVGVQHSCGVRTDGIVACWGNDYYGQTQAPGGNFNAIAAGGAHSCGLRTDGTVACWGFNDDGQADAPGGNFNAIAAGGRHSCGLRTDGTVACWGTNDDGQADAPGGNFNAIAAGGRHSCGLRTDGTVVCWGTNFGGETDAPGGEFAAIAASDVDTCGLRPDGSVACWGVEVVPPPAGARRAVPPDHPDPSVCRPYGPSFGTTAGFPLPAWAAPSRGTLRVAVLFVDFPDMASRHSVEQEAELGLPFAERYLESVSFGRLDVEFVSLLRWLRAEHGHSHYLSEGVTGTAWVGRAVSDEAVRLAGSDVDFAEFDIMMVVMPSSHFSGGNAGGEVETPAGRTTTTRVNTNLREERGDPYEWGRTAAHELVHNLGLLDLYPHDDSRHEKPDAPSGRAWIDVELGLMRMRAHFVTSSQDPRLAHVWRFPDGYRSTSHRHDADALEMLAWSRWQLGWLDAGSVRCITGPDATVALRPVAEVGEGIAMAAVPLSGHEVIVVESRRKVGYDLGLEYRASDGASTTFPALVEEGVLVYTVNAQLGSGDLPLRVAGDTGNGQVDDYPILAVGESVTVRGHTITVVSDDGDTHTVRVVRSQDA